MATNVTQQTSASLTAQDTGTGWVRAGKGDTLEVSPGTGGVATVTLQRRLRDATDTTVHDVKDYAISADPEIVNVENDWEYRMHIKTGNYTSGTVVPYIWKT